MQWTVEYLNAVVEEEFEVLPRDLRARFEHIVALLQSGGVASLRSHHAKHLEGPLWEMRLQGRDRIARVIYVTEADRRIVVVRIFIKKTQKTPRREIELALRRVKEGL
jgi:phage-related protein